MREEVQSECAQKYETEKNMKWAFRITKFILAPDGILAR